MQNIYPPDRVLVSSELPLTFGISQSVPYIDIFTEQERDVLYNKYKTPNLFNGTCIRLDSLVNSHAVVSPVTFFDFLFCNIAGVHNKDPLAWSKLSQYLNQYGKLDSFDKVLRVRELPNIIGTSTLLHDINDDFLLVERNTAVSVGSGLFACTSSGSLDENDIAAPNPIIGCGVRELIEELNLNCTLSIEGIVMPKQKMQPIALLTGQVFRPWRELLPTMIHGADFSKENSRILIVPRDRLLPMISLYAFTDAAAFHIFFEAGGTKQRWKELEYSFINIKDYYVK